MQAITHRDIATCNHITKTTKKLTTKTVCYKCLESIQQDECKHVAQAGHLHAKKCDSVKSVQTSGCSQGQLPKPPQRKLLEQQRLNALRKPWNFKSAPSVCQPSYCGTVGRMDLQYVWFLNHQRSQQLVNNSQLKYKFSCITRLRPVPLPNTTLGGHELRLSCFPTSPMDNSNQGDPM